MSIEFNNLKLFRKQNGFTQEEVAEKLNVSRQAVAKWESGETVPDIENCIALADIYGTTVDHAGAQSDGGLRQSGRQKAHIRLLQNERQGTDNSAEEMPRGIRTQPRRRYTCSWGRGQGNGSREAGRSYRGRQKCVRRQTQ